MHRTFTYGTAKTALFPHFLPNFVPHGNRVLLLVGTPLWYNLSVRFNTATDLKKKKERSTEMYYWIIVLLAVWYLVTGI
jgi:hypothetical protein